MWLAHRTLIIQIWCEIIFWGSIFLMRDNFPSIQDDLPRLDLEQLPTLNPGVSAYSLSSKPQADRFGHGLPPCLSTISNQLLVFYYPSHERNRLLVLVINYYFIGCQLPITRNYFLQFGDNLSEKLLSKSMPYRGHVSGFLEWNHMDWETLRRIYWPT